MRETETAAPAAVLVAGNDNRADIGDGKGGFFFSGQFRPSLCSVQSFGSSYISLGSGMWFDSRRVSFKFGFCFQFWHGGFWFDR
ncbi:hypothetical protein Hanom_Chr15g01361851 [Helianthus anomalus]